MFARPLRAAAALAVIALLATGCTGSPAPAPTTPTPLSDDEAYAAAEATYRAYVDALNQVDLSDPDTFEPVYALTTGDANANERETLSQMHADGWSIDGQTSLVWFRGVELRSETPAELLARACSDVSDVEVKDAAGASQVSPDRPARYALELTFRQESGSIKLAASNAVEDAECR